jgi:hypothetical protein
MLQVRLGIVMEEARKLVVVVVVVVVSLLLLLSLLLLSLVQGMVGGRWVLRGMVSECQ